MSDGETLIVAQLLEGADSGKVSFTYRNHRGEVAKRSVKPRRLWFGSSEWHPDPQWLLSAWCCDRKATRVFALSEITMDSAP